jgi:hypothetical protein
MLTMMQHCQLLDHDPQRDVYAPGNSMLYLEAVSQKFDYKVCDDEEL